MPSIECGFPGDPGLLALNGPQIMVNIGFDPIYDPEINARLNIPEYLFPALIDTGATESCIDATLAKALELPVVDTRAIVGIHGPQATELHRAQIRIPDLSTSYDGRFAGIPLRTSGAPFYALLGRDFLTMLSMVYSGETGSVIVQSSRK